MKALDRIAYGFDRTLSFFAPHLALRRMQARDRLVTLSERMYAAARPTKDAHGWMPLDPDVNTAIRLSQQPVRARVRQLVRDFVYFDRAVKLSTALVVGTGITLQARFYDDNGLMKRVNSRIEEEWAAWCDNADYSGRLTFQAMQELAERQRMECGEFLFILRYDRKSFRLQPVEADRLVSYGAKADKGNEVDSGIEYSISTGEVCYYWIADTAFSSLYQSSGKVMRVPAAYVVHGFQSLRPQQLRGISPLASSVLIAGDLAELLDSELDATRLHSKFLGFVQSNDIPGYNAARAENKNSERRVEYLENATLEYLRQGDSIELATLNRQGATFEPFLRFNLRTLAVGAGLTYELLTGDYDKISYSNLRGIRLDLANTLLPTQLFHIRAFCEPVFRAWLRWKMLIKPEILPSQFYPIRPWNIRWIAPGMESADPLKEIKAFAEEMALGVRSPQEWTARRGRDLEDVLDEIQEAKRMAAERDIVISPVSTANTNNPAALMEETVTEGANNATEE